MHASFHTEYDSVTTSPLTSSTDLTASILPSSSGYIVSLTPSVTIGKTKLETYTIH